MVRLTAAALEKAPGGRPAVFGVAGSAALHLSIAGIALLAAGLFHVAHKGAEPVDAIEVAIEAPFARAQPAPPVVQPETPKLISRIPLSTAPSDIAAKPIEEAKPVAQPESAAVPQFSPSPSSAAQSVPAVTISPKERDAYVSTLMAWLSRFKQYPAESRRERVQGVVVVRFTIDSSGQVFSSSIARSSGHASLDRAAIDMFTRASPLPKPPQAFMRGAQTTLTLPVEFSLITR